MGSTIEKPKLRPVEAIPTRDGLICLRDPLGLSDQLLLLPREALFIVSLFDGEHSILDVQYEFARRFGTILPSDKVREIVAQLDGCLFLDTEGFHEARRRIVEAFRSAPVRPTSHAGTAYQGEPEALRRQLQELFGGLSRSGALDATGAVGTPAPDSAGALARVRQSPAGGTSGPPASGRLRGLIAPHIDLHRGGHGYATAYSELGRTSEAETFVVLGIAHAPMRRRFALCVKDFATPLGTVPLDRGFCESLQRRLHSDFQEDEFVHRSEHSVEFQAVFLQYLYGERRSVRLVPILCGGFEKAAASGLPEDEAEVREFLEALGGTLAERGQSVCCIAGVDLSHLGRRFGQELRLDDSVLKQAEADDRRMIDRVLAGDAEGFFRLIQEERDRRNVCGVPAIYTLLRLLEGSQGPGALLHYGQAVEEDRQSVVTFMSAAFYA